MVEWSTVSSLRGTTLKLNYVGKNHSDSTLVMRLPKEKVIFMVDWIPIQGVQFRGMADTYVPDIEEGLKKGNCNGLGNAHSGHPGHASSKKEPRKSSRIPV